MSQGQGTGTGTGNVRVGLEYDRVGASRKVGIGLGKAGEISTLIVSSFARHFTAMRMTDNDFRSSCRLLYNGLFYA